MYNLPATLVSNYSRSVIGFDLRLHNIDHEHTYELNSYLYFWYTQTHGKYPCTLDEQALPHSKRKADLSVAQNGFQLYDVLTDEMLEIASHKDDLLMAYDAPTDYAVYYSETFGIHPMPLKIVSENARWAFAGYDVTDPMTISSAFYGYEWSRAKILEILARYNIVLNDNGLLNNIDSAIELSKDFSKRISSHAPFVPCGVWIWH